MNDQSVHNHIYLRLQNLLGKKKHDLWKMCSFGEGFVGKRG